MAGIQQVWTHPPPGQIKGKSLLESMGGVGAVTYFVNVFYDGMLKDKEVAPVLKKSQQTQSEEIYMKLLKERTVEYLECVWGGDAWEGQDMFVAHAALHISTKTYDAAMKIAKNIVAGMAIPPEAKKLMMEELWALKEPMCDADGKFHRWVHEKNKAIEQKMLDDGAVDLTGMGFTSSPAMVKAMKDKAEKEAQRKERMLEQKKKREAEEKARKKKEKEERKGKEKGQLAVEPQNASPTESPRPTSEAPSERSETSEAKAKSKAKAKPKAKTQSKTKSEDKTIKEETVSIPLVIPSLPDEGDLTADIPESRSTPLFLPPRAFADRVQTLVA